MWAWSGGENGVGGRGGGSWSVAKTCTWLEILVTIDFALGWSGVDFMISLVASILKFAI